MATVKETVKFDGRLVTIFDYDDLEWEGYAPNEDSKMLRKWKFLAFEFKTKARTTSGLRLSLAMKTMTMTRIWKGYRDESIYQ